MGRPVAPTPAHSLDLNEVKAVCNQDLLRTIEAVLAYLVHAFLPQAEIPTYHTTNQ